MITSVPKLLRILSKNSKLFESLFEKRNRLVSIHEVMEEIDEGEIEYLLETELLIRSDESLELDERLLNFFEAFLETNTDVEIADVSELLENLSYNISQFRLTNNVEIREKYLAKINRILKKIPYIILKNLNLLQLHIGLSYKTSLDHKNKLAELEFYKTKLEKLITIEESVGKSLNIQNTFFQSIASYETAILYYRLKERLSELQMSLIELQKQVIEYINKTLYNVHLYEHIIRLKELKTSHEIKEKSNILTLLQEEKTPLFLSKKILFSTFLEVEYIYETEFEVFVRRWQNKNLTPIPQKLKAMEVDTSFFEIAESEYSIVDIHSLHREFMQTSQHLFAFVLEKRFDRKPSFEELLTIYCQLALSYEHEYHFENKYATHNGYEYLLIYPEGVA